MKQSRMAVIIAVVGVICAACTGGEEIQEPTQPVEEPAQSSEPSSEPMVQDQPVASYFQDNCARCHGENREGRNGPALLPDSLSRDNAYYLDIIRNGKRGMPSFGSKLSDKEIQILIDFLRTES
ncbi:MAG: cytochrome c [Anaerolineales bacterium]